jgi:hypothetical protein
MPFEQPKSNENRDGFCFDSLYALAKRGPVWDGDIPSKSGRDELIEKGLAIRVIFNGEDGHTALTYKGRDFFVNYMGCTTLEEALAKQRKSFEEGWRERNPEAVARGEQPPV